MAGDAPAAVWLRRSVGSSGSLLVGTRPDDRLVVVTPAGPLDGMGDLLAGDAR